MVNRTASSHPIQQCLPIKVMRVVAHERLAQLVARRICLWVQLALVMFVQVRFSEIGYPFSGLPVMYETMSRRKKSGSPFSRC
jgi:hypothetical protein